MLTLECQGAIAVSILRLRKYLNTKVSKYRTEVNLLIKIIVMPGDARINIKTLILRSTSCVWYNLSRLQLILILRISVFPDTSISSSTDDLCV